MIKFEGFAIDVTAEEVEASKKKGNNNFLEAGEHELEIVNVEYKGSVAPDPTWLKFDLYLHNPGTEPGDDGKFKGAVKHNVMVPTANIRYKDSLTVFGMLQAFFDGLGENLTPSSVPELIPAYFSDFEKLKGMKLKVKLGYKGNHIAYKDKTYFLADKNGNPLTIPGGVVNSFANKESAEGQAFTSGVIISRTAPDGRVFNNKLEVLRVLPGPKQREDKPKGKSKAKASADW